MNKAEISFEETKKLELEILHFIHNICVENHIHYYIAYGTLLGAVRHKGFIPWDDDIDIWIPINEYDIFAAVIKNNAKYSFIDWNTDDDYYYPFGKVVINNTILVEPEDYKIHRLGVYVDVFPLLGMDDNTFKDKLSHLYWKILYIFWRYSSIKRANVQTNPIKKALRWIPFNIARIKGFKFWLKKYERSMKRHPVCGQKFLGDVYGYRFYNKRFAECELEFEDGLFKAPVNYKECLTNIYGNYMQLPPLEKRVSHHGFKAWYK